LTAPHFLNIAGGILRRLLCGLAHRRLRIRRFCDEIANRVAQRLHVDANCFEIVLEVFFRSPCHSWSPVRGAANACVVGVERVNVSMPAPARGSIVPDLRRR
jgi:hypothetical protein